MAYNSQLTGAVQSITPLQTTEWQNTTGFACDKEPCLHVCGCVRPVLVNAVSKLNRLLQRGLKLEPADNKSLVRSMAAPQLRIAASKQGTHSLYSRGVMQCKRPYIS